MAFRLAIFALLVGSFLLIRHVKAHIWPLGGHPAHDPFDRLVQAGAILWVLILPWALADVFGWLLYPRHTPANVEAGRPGLGSTIGNLVVFRIVTRGDQPSIAIASVWAVLEAMQRRPLFPFRVEVVSDMPVAGLPEHPSVAGIVVPEGYETPQGATHKARALHYALSNSEMPDDAWILHLDEESHVTEEVVIGIRTAVFEEERNGRHRIGQGLITYHRDLRVNPHLSRWPTRSGSGTTWGASTSSTALHWILFGMHGSFLLVRKSVERQVGFDFPPEACTTEDTHVGALPDGGGQPLSLGRRDGGRAVARGVPGLRAPARVDGSPGCGGPPDARRFPLDIRASLWLAMFLWTVGWTGFAYSLLHILSGVEVPHPPGRGRRCDLRRLPHQLPDGAVGEPVGAGTHRGASSRGLLRRAGTAHPRIRRIEASAVIYSLVRPERRFHVVRKPVVEQPEDDAGQWASLTAGSAP